MLDDPEEGNSASVLLLPDSTTNTNGSTHYHWKADEDDDDDDEAQVVETRAVMRRYGSGLGNLGNTCFMNSTLQCLAHTDPLRKYFLSGDYDQDLNQDNPLGTGGDLATQFALLMAEMWRTNGGGASCSLLMNSRDPQSTTNVVYPRSFKFTLGKHAEQFMGYDQHDSQEFATYLLDALHEDTNRVTKKPYVEKPEQADNETDEEAADKAWELHLRREDSHVLENFMGQVKSRVQCCTEDCRRVSTTFDPFMFLSVPIPGSSERTIPITFVPLNPQQRAKIYPITINKLASMGDLVKKVQVAIAVDGHNVHIDDLAICDVWKKDIHSWHALDSDLDIIRESDETAVYELTPLAKIREESKALKAKETVDLISLGLDSRTTRPRRYQLEVAELRRINECEQWVKEMEKYVRSYFAYYKAFHPRDGSTEARVTIYKKLTTFIDLCYKEVETANDTAGQKRGRDGEPDGDDNGTIFVTPEDPPVREIEDRADTQQTFKNVRSLYDVVVLDFLSKKVRAEIIKLEKEKTPHFEDGVVVEVRMRKNTIFTSREENLSAPLALRISSGMTVYGLREELARRLSRSLKIGREQVTSFASGEKTTENDVGLVSVPHANGGEDSRLGSPALLCLRQVPLAYQRGSMIRNHSTAGRQLGSLQKPGIQSFDGTRPIALASPTDEKEKASVADLAGDQGTVFMDWPEELAERYFDATEFESVDDADAPTGDNGKSRQRSNATSVLDCIEKYCQMEQLEDSEMWYCNRCKEHVRAWKQFHIFRSPPILLVHLKRFQFSPRTHRRDKIGVFIDFPLKNLDLSDQVLHWTDEEKPIYDCYAVSNHYGGLGGGHYTAYALNNDGEWCYYDDSRITTGVDPKEVVSDAAYVLYYRRRDVPVGEEFVMNLQTPGMRSPVLIQVDKGRDNEASEVSSNAAMVGDEMDVDDIASRTTSPMGSTDDGEDQDQLYTQNDYSADAPDDMGLPPLQ